MQQKDVEIVNKLGLHARPSARLTQLASSFRCEVFMARNGRRINAKSIMGVMMLAAAKGSTVTIETEGVDEVAALAALTELVESGFGEELV
ncbi:MAG: HPr family phosphocarrier protein [Thiobacillus sp.]